MERGSPDKPVRLMILDTIVALTTWTASAGPNSDEGVKRMLAYVRGISTMDAVVHDHAGHATMGRFVPGNHADEVRPGARAVAFDGTTQKRKIRAASTDRLIDLTG